MKPKRLWSVTLSTVCILIAALFFCSVISHRHSKDYIFDYVHSNYSELEQLVESILQSEDQTPMSFDAWSVRLYKDASMIQFEGSPRGFGPSCIYTGFYYSIDGMPKGFDGAKVVYSPDSPGWHWEEDTGDNYAYTEKIIEKWYFFEMRF